MSEATHCPKTTLNIGANQLLVGVDLGSLSDTSLGSHTSAYRQVESRTAFTDRDDFLSYIQQLHEQDIASQAADRVIGPTIHRALTQTVATSDDLWTSAVNGSLVAQEALNRRFAEKLIRVEVVDGATEDDAPGRIRDMPVVFAMRPPERSSSPSCRYESLQPNENPTVEIKLQNGEGLSTSRAIDRVTCDISGLVRVVSTDEAQGGSSPTIVHANDLSLQTWIEGLQGQAGPQETLLSFAEGTLSKQKAEDELSDYLGAYTRQHHQLWGGAKTTQGSRPDTKRENTHLSVSPLQRPIPVEVSMSYPSI